MEPEQKNNNLKVIMVIVAIIILSALVVYLYTRNSQVVSKNIEIVKVDQRQELQGNAPPISDEASATIRSELAKPPATSLSEEEKEKVRAELSK